MEESKVGLKPISTRRRFSPTIAMDEEEEEEDSAVPEPLSPVAHLFHTPKLNMFVVVEIGLKTKIDVEVIKDGLERTLINHPRFSSKLVFNTKRDEKPVGWVRTKVNVDDHITVPDLDTNMGLPDQIVEDYVSNITNVPMDFSKPLWDVHVLHIETSKAKAVGILRIHHSLGDGISLISLLLACARKSSDPKAVPSLPVDKKNKNNKEPQTSNCFLKWFLWLLFMFKVLFNTLVDLIMFIATTICLKDTSSPLKGSPGTVKSSVRFVHRTLCLDDIKVVKNAMNLTVNDVVLGITQAGLSQYLYRNHGKTKGDNNFQQHSSPKRIRLRASLMVNLRPSTMIQGLATMMEENSKGGWDWGNLIGYILIPFHIVLRDDPLDHIRDAKTTMDRKKQSLEARFTYAIVKFLVNTLGSKAAINLTYRVLSNTTLMFSNVVGPMEEISFYGYPVAYLAPTAYGIPQALTIHLLSYMNKMTLVVAVDQDVIPDPHRLCDDIEEALQLARKAVVEK